MPRNKLPAIPFNAGHPDGGVKPIPMSPQEEADRLPMHPLLGRWMACNCGSPSCRRVYPTRMGTFSQGTGFELEEAQSLVAELIKVWQVTELRHLNDTLQRRNDRLILAFADLSEEIAEMRRQLKKRQPRSPRKIDSDIDKLRKSIDRFDTIIGRQEEIRRLRAMLAAIEAAAKKVHDDANQDI